MSYLTDKAFKVVIIYIIGKIKEAMIKENKRRYDDNGLLNREQQLIEMIKKREAKLNYRSKVAQKTT